MGDILDKQLNALDAAVRRERLQRDIERGEKMRYSQDDLQTLLARNKHVRVDADAQNRRRSANR